MLPVLILISACGSDTTEPDPTTQPVTSAAVSVNPGKVTAETNQLIRFLATGRNSAGARIAAPVVWSSTGGTILPDGRFSAPVTGRYLVIGANMRYRGRVDTAEVEVVRRQPELASVVLRPDTVTLTAGASKTFLAKGLLKDGRSVPIGINWSATGGTIDAGGMYLAGDSAGTFQVIATDTRLILADTATVVINVPVVPPAPDTVPVPAPEPQPQLGQVTLVPASATLARSSTRQFTAFGRLQGGDSVAVDVAFTATGGSITESGLFTAGSSAGTFRVIATADSLADTSTVTVTVPLGSGPAGGTPFGAFHVPVDSLNSANLDYSAAAIAAVPENLTADLTKVRARQGRVILAIRRSRTKDANGLSVAATRAELASWPDISGFIADGTVIGVYVSDDILSSEWGPNAPYLSRIDSLAREVKLRWPNAITMVRAKPTELSGRSRWIWLETAWAQYRGPYRDPPPTQFADREVASAKALGLGLVIWFNALNGGCGPTTACLPGIPGTSIIGTYADAAALRRYQLSAAEALAYGTAFLAEPYNCAAVAWQYSPVYKNSSLPPEQLASVRAFDSRPDVRAAMARLAELARQRPNTSCRQR
ncbi:MAG TPA: hypothetical protein VGP44_09535 [Gemmatimonadales bacterium]|nr:hypothetical protein [Gemmatimonadales bacterium]